MGLTMRPIRNPKGRFLITVLALGFAFLVIAMGKLDPSGNPDEIPLPDKEITVILTDLEGLTLSLTQFSLDGRTFLSGRLGAGKVAIPFNQIRVITFFQEGKTLGARVDLADHTQMNMQLEKGILSYGRLRAGTYQIPIEKIKKIEIQAVADRKK